MDFYLEQDKKGIAMCLTDQADTRFLKKLRNFEFERLEKEFEEKQVAEQKAEEQQKQDDDEILPVDVVLGF
jgi:uncharacterized protein YlbG (UPF0298 family)